MQVLYEDPDEEDRESKDTKDMNSPIIKTSDQQIEEHSEKPILNPDNDFSIKCTEQTIRPTMVIIFTFIFKKNIYTFVYLYENEFLKFFFHPR